MKEEILTYLRMMESNAQFVGTTSEKAALITIRTLSENLSKSIDRKLNKTDTKRLELEIQEPSKRLEEPFIEPEKVPVSRVGFILPSKTVCKFCGKEVKGKKGKLYCDDLCRSAYHNQKPSKQ